MTVIVSHLFAMIRLLYRDAIARISFHSIDENGFAIINMTSRENMFKDIFRLP